MLHPGPTNGNGAYVSQPYGSLAPLKTQRARTFFKPDAYRYLLVLLFRLSSHNLFLSLEAPPPLPFLALSTLPLLNFFLSLASSAILRCPVEGSPF